MIWQTKSRFAFLGIGFWLIFLSSVWLWNRFFNSFNQTHLQNLENKSETKLEIKLENKLVDKKSDMNTTLINLEEKMIKFVKKNKDKNKIRNIRNFNLTKEFIQFFFRLRRIWFFLIIILPIFIGVVAINLPVEILNKLPVEIAKPSSTFWHGMRTGATIELIQKNSSKWFLGFGLGASGPVAKLEYYDIKKAEIFEKNEQIAYKYRLVGEDLTIPENWFLQVFLNGGIMYFVLYLSILTLAIQPLQTFLKANLNLNFKVNSNSEKKSETALEDLDSNVLNVSSNLLVLSSKSKNSKPILPKILQNDLQNGNKNGKLQNGKLEKSQNNLNNFKITRSILASLAFFGILIANLFLHIFEVQIIVLYWSFLYLWANLPTETDQNLMSD